MSSQTAENTYEERNSGSNFAEDFFEAYCSKNTIPCWRLGFNEKQNRVSSHLFKVLNPYIRNLPDYLIEKNHKPYLVICKGSDSFKQAEMNLLKGFIDRYWSKGCDLLYAFCIRGNKAPLFYTPSQVRALYDRAGVDQVWASDGKIFRKLQLPKPNHNLLQVVS